VPASSFAGVFLSVTIAPPVLPVYAQPPCPGDGYLWTPGYWAWGGGGYYWVPGTWVQPPRIGVLWTPGYWGFVGGVYAFHAGYWGPHVGFYGGVNYGFGYVGSGFAGGAWVGGSFSYNRAVTNVNVNIVHNTYNTTVINNVTVNKVSYNGGAGGIAAAPTAQERQFSQEPHVPPTQLQQQHVQQAAQNPALAARANGAIPPSPRPRDRRHSMHPVRSVPAVRRRWRRARRRPMPISRLALRLRRPRRTGPRRTTPTRRRSRIQSRVSRRRKIRRRTSRSRNQSRRSRKTRTVANSDLATQGPRSAPPAGPGPCPILP